MLNRIISEQSIERAGRLLDSTNKIVIVTHVSPDGDAIGSSLALFHYLQRIGKVAHVIVPNNYPGFLKWVEGSKEVIVSEWKPALAEELLRTAGLIFCLDFNEPKRVDSLKAALEKTTAPKILIDHHP